MFLVFMMRLSGPVKVCKEEVESHIGHVLRLGWIRQGQYWTSCHVKGIQSFQIYLTLLFLWQRFVLSLEPDGAVGMRL